MLDNPNTIAQDNTNTTTHKDVDEQYLPMHTNHIPMLDNPNKNAQDN